jgi:hypothetical protein
VSPFDQAARDAGRALGDCGAAEESAFVDEIAGTLAELEAEPKPTRSSRRRKSEARISKLETNPKSE